MNSYKLLPPSVISVNCVSSSSGWQIPFCPDNMDYQRFKVDVEAGAELLDADGNIIDGKEFIKELP